MDWLFGQSVFFAYFCRRLYKKGMKIRIILITIGLASSLLCTAQRKEIAQAQAYIKSGKDFDKAEKLMTGLLAKDSVNRQNKKIYFTWFETVRMQYEAANEKLYLRQKYDTVQFFNLVRKMFQIAETLDSLDARPDKKGRVRPEYRKGRAEYLHHLRRNLYYGGTFQVRKGRFGEAFGFLETFLDAAREPLFTGYDYLVTDTLMPQAAYWATFSAYRQQHPDSVLRYSELALKDTARREFTMQYVCEALRQRQCDSAYVARLREGFDSFPTHHYFFPRLADYYTQKGDYDKVLALCEEGLSAAPDNQLMLLAKSVAQLNKGDDEGCINTSERLIALNDTLAEAYFNIATVKLNKALELERENEPRKNRKQLTALYTEARPYMEAFRKLSPADEPRWAPALYRIYLNLNMGKQFEEIDRVMRKAKS